MAEKTTKKRSTSAKGRRRASGQSKKMQEAGGRSAPQQRTSGSERSTFDPHRAKVLHDDESVAEQPESGRGRMSGDLQSLSDQELADSESVQELAEEGQDLEGELVKGIEDVPDEAGVPRHNFTPDGEEIPDFKKRNRI